MAVSPIVGGAALKGPADRMLTELGHEPSVVGVARLYAPIAGTLVIDPVDAHLAGCGRGRGHARRGHPVGDEQPRDRGGTGPASRCRGRFSPVTAGRRARSVHGAHARWMRARVGDSANRAMSLGRRGAVDRVRARPGPAISAHRSRIEVLTPGPDVDDQTAAAAAGAHERVDRIVDVQEVAGLTAVAVDQRARRRCAARGRTRRPRRRRRAGAARRRCSAPAR